MKTAGSRKERPISLSASANLLADGARFNEEFQRLPLGRLTAIPKGVYRFQTHAAANRHDTDCLAERMARWAEARA